jgi:hypothetical protein
MRRFHQIKNYTQPLHQLTLDGKPKEIRIRQITIKQNIAAHFQKRIRLHVTKIEFFVYTYVD